MLYMYTLFTNTVHKHMRLINVCKVVNFALYLLISIYAFIPDKCSYYKLIFNILLVPQIQLTRIS